MAQNSSLDPQVAALLEAAAKAGRPLVHTLSPDAARQQFKETRGPLQPPPPPMARVDDLTVPGRHGPIAVRHFRPMGAADEAMLPALVYFHGGGWVIGDIDTHDTVCRQLADASGCAVVSVNYRKAPEHKFPAAVDDAWAATQWVAGNPAALRIDPRRLAVGGDSAGGNLAAVVSIMARDIGLAPGGQAALRLQLLIYPATDMAMEQPSIARFADGYLLTRESMRWFIGHYLRSAEDVHDWRASPLLASSLHDLPPAHIITAGFDPLRDEGQAYARRLAEAGNMVDYVEYGGMVHGFIGMGGVLATANRAVATAAAALRQALAEG